MKKLAKPSGSPATSRSNDGLQPEVRKRLEAAALAMTASVVTAAIGGVTVVAYQLALTQPDGRGIPLLVAAVTFVGTALTAVTALIGFQFKRTFDNRTFALLAQEQARKEADQTRLTAETAIAAVRLVNGEISSPASAIQVAAVLTVLNRIGERGLALRLLKELWPTGAVASASAVTLCDDALRSGNAELQADSALLLRKNWRLLQSDSEELLWPSALRVPLTVELSEGAREQIVQLLEEWISVQPLRPVGEFRSRLLAELRPA